MTAARQQGRGWASRQGQSTTTAPFQRQVCITVFRDPGTGRFAPKPKQGKPGRAVARGGKATHGMILMRNVVEGEVYRAKVVDMGARTEQRRGNMTKKQVRETENGLSDDYLAHLNPRLAASIENDRMRAAHASDKAKRGTQTRKAKAATKKHRPAEAIKVDHMKAHRDLNAIHGKLNAVKSPVRREQLRGRQRRLEATLTALHREAKQAGVKL